MKIEVIGTGNVGMQFARIFDVNPVSSRTLDGLQQNADLYIIAVRDSAVADVAAKLPRLNGVVVHTTGSVPIDVLMQVDCKGYGVFYPFQTISKERPLPSSSIPLLIEANDGNTEDFLISVANTYCFDKITKADSKQRGIIHLTGTFACNFTNAMIDVAQKILHENGIDEAMLTPLISETFNKLKAIRANDAQTGPAVRKDYPTMQKHLSLLNEMDMQVGADIYEAISRYIMVAHKG